MQGSPAIYLGRIVPKDNFRTFIYASEGRQKLVESWDEFEANMQSGVWFATAEEANGAQEIEKAAPKQRASRAKKTIPVTRLELKEDAPIEELDESIPDDVAFEVTDDFLPKG